jgi:hypothetical protein
MVTNKVCIANAHVYVVRMRVRVWARVRVWG